MARRIMAVVATTIVLVSAFPSPSHAEVTAPPTGPAPAVLSPTAVVDSTAPAPTKAGVQRAVLGTLKASALGQFSAVVIDPSTDTVLLDVRAGTPRTPASTIKLLTSAAALTVLDPASRLATTVVASGDSITLVGGGDATLARTKRRGVEAATLADLADQVSKQVVGTPVRLAYDDSLFSGPELGPGWPASFPAAGVVAPVTALMVDQGRVRPNALSRVANPARQAAQVFAGLLDKRGVTVTSVRKGKAPKDATEIGRVESATIGDLVERLLTDSENDLGEALGHLVGGKVSGKATFATGAAGVEKTAAELGLVTKGLSIVDGSGLSGRDRVPALTLVGVLDHVSRQTEPALWPIGPGLPVSGFTGTLADRYGKGLSASAAGYVRAKTGTLSGVVALAGTVKDVDGRVLVFAVMANNVRSLDGARLAVDEFASRLSKCGCS